MPANFYDPLDYDNLTANLVRELMSRPPASLPPEEAFAGPGVYALFYQGDFEPYAAVRTDDASRPIYVGSAIPKGGRKGGADGNPQSRTLYNRLCRHATSIEAVDNLRLEDFVCRYVTVKPLWILMAERFLLDHYQPIWNVCIEGFGNHDPGSGRHQGEITWWDALHPGREWAKKLRQSRSQADVLVRLRTRLG